MPLFDLPSIAEVSSPPADVERKTRSTSAIEAFENMHIEKVHNLKDLLGRVARKR